MGGVGSGRKPSEATIARRYSEPLGGEGTILDIPNVSHIKQEARMVTGLASVVMHVNHGATAGTARPTTKSDVIVLWIGSVEPTNALNNDLWVDTS